MIGLLEGMRGSELVALLVCGGLVLMTVLHAVLRALGVRWFVNDATQD